MINISILYVFEEKYLAIISEFLRARDRIISTEHIRIQIIFCQIIINFSFIFNNILDHILKL